MPPAVTSTTTLATTTTSTTLLSGSDCVGGVSILGSKVRLTKLGSPGGNEGLSLAGVLAFSPGAPAGFNPVARGMQLLLEDIGDDPPARVVDLTAPTRALRAGGRGTGCDPKDGWKGVAYRNRSDAIDPPICTLGSARGLKSVRLEDRRGRGKGIALRAAFKGAALARPVGPLRLTVVLSAEATAAASGECASYTFPVGSCRARGTSFVCK